MKKTIAWLGAGAMGQHMVTRLLEAGYPVRLYNRTASALDTLVEKGGVRTSSPKEAAQSAEIIISMIVDDEVSEAVWFDERDGAALGVAPGCLVVESSTLTPMYTEHWARRMTEAGAIPVCAPVAGSLPQAEQGLLVYFAAGPHDGLDALEPVLLTMGQTVHRMGDAPEMAALMKLIVNGIFASQVTVLGEMFGLATHAGLEPEKMASVLGTLPTTSPALKGIAGLMLKDFRQSMFPIRLVEKDMRYVLAAAQSSGCEMPTIQTTQTRYRAAMDAGYGDENINVVARLCLDN